MSMKKAPDIIWQDAEGETRVEVFENAQGEVAIRTGFYQDVSVVTFKKDDFYEFVKELLELSKSIRG